MGVGGSMRIIACLDQPEVIEKILTHLVLRSFSSCPSTWRSDL